MKYVYRHSYKNYLNTYKNNINDVNHMEIFVKVFSKSRFSRLLVSECFLKK